jgi:hypothetical protein
MFLLVESAASYLVWSVASKIKKKGYDMKYTAVICGLIMGVTGVSTAVVSSVDEMVMVSFDQDSSNTVGTVQTDLSGTYDFAVRERSSAGQTNRRIVSYVKFDLSGLTTELVNSADFKSTLTLDFSTRLNDVNDSSVRVGQVASSNTWSDAVGSYPLASWYTPPQTTTGQEVIANIKTLDPAAATNEIVLDVTSWVQDWVNGTVPNNGLAFFIPTYSAQAAGFTVTSLESKEFIAFAEFTNAVDSDWSNANNWDIGNYPQNNQTAVLNTTAVLSDAVPNNILAIQIGTDGTGVLNLEPGSALQATADGSSASEVGAGTGNAGTINQTGGTHELNYLEIGIGGTGRVDISGGDLTLSGSSDDVSIYLGSGAGGDGTVEISGGALGTDGGIYLGLPDGSGTGIFSVQGAGATEISIGSEGDIDGSWYQNSGSTLRIGISTNGVASILLADNINEGPANAVFASGAVLDVEFIDGASETNSWPVMVCEGLMTDFGMVFDSGMGSTTNDWGFRIVDDTLYVGYGLGWSAGGEIVTGQSDLIDATFNGIDDGLNESFSVLGNGFGEPIWSNENGEASFTTNDTASGANGVAGCVSDASINGGAFSGLTATFVIDDITDDNGGPLYNGHWIGLTGNNTQTWNNAQLEAAPDGWAVGIRFISGSVDFVYDNTNGHRAVIGSLGTYTSGSLQDGYTAKMVMDTNGWSVAVNGIDTAVGGSGIWPAGFDFSYIQADPDLFASMTYQVGNESNVVVDVTSIKVSGIIGAGDNDNDDIPNDYEAANGLNPDDPSDRDTDLDGDGLSNYEEYLAGTAANDSDSVLKLTRAESLAGGDFVITWQSVEGKSYSVITNTSLTIPVDGVVASGIPGKPDETSYTGTVSGAAAVFYEIVVE